MDTTERRMKLARQLRRLADMVGNAERADDFDNALEELRLVGRDVNGYHARTLDAMYEKEYAPAIEAMEIRKICLVCSEVIHPMQRFCEAHK